MIYYVSVFGNLRLSAVEVVVVLDVDDGCVVGIVVVPSSGKLGEADDGERLGDADRVVRRVVIRFII